MASSMEAGGANEPLDINQWLQDNKLKNLKPYFEDNEIEMEDLLEFEQTEIELSSVSEYTQKST